MSDLHHLIKQTRVRTLRLRSDAQDSELRALYANLMAYCILIQDHLERIDSAGLTLQRALAASLVAKLEAVNLSTLAYAGDGLQGDVINVGAVQDLLDFLVTWEDDVRAQYPDDCPWAVEDYAPQEKIQDPPFAVWKAARAVYDVLLSCQGCTCYPAHGARLRLGTYRKPSSDDDDDNEEEVNFDMFLPAMQDWQEVRVHSARERSIQFAVMEDEATTAQTAKRTAKMKIRRLCEQILKLESLNTYRRELQVKDGKLFKLRSERSDQLIDLSKTPVSLDDFLRARPRSFTEKTKRILMIILSCAVLHLYDTPWLQSTWNSANIIFFRSRNSETPLRPFLDTSLSIHVPPGRDTTADLDEYEDEDIDPDEMMQHPCPVMITLAVMLMEVFFAAPFEELAQQFNVRIRRESAGLFQYLDADMVFQACKGEIPENSHFLSVIDKCLDPATWKDEDDATLDTQAMRGVIYEVVVKPLENDLRQAYSSISIESLDNFAQSLDMSSWDQAIRNQWRDGELAVKVHVGLNQAPSLFSDQNSQPEDPHGSVIAIRPPDDSEYKDSKFFDDELASPEKSGQYTDWKAKYFAVYKKFIIPYAKRAPNRVKIAVLDTGIDSKHPDIQACSDNIKKRHNFLTDGSTDMSDSEGHGTFVTALLLEYAPDADIYVGKVAVGEEPSSPDCIAKAIRHAVDEWKVDMISMSFGYPTCSISGYPKLVAALEYADYSGVLLFAAASNNGGRRGRAFPAQEKNVICVHSTDTNANRSSFSPTPVKSKLNFATVGEGVESAWPERLCNDKSVVATKSGTSFATPIMVGVAALLVRYIRLHIMDKKAVVGQRRMENLLRKVAQKGPDGEERDGYWFVDVSLFDDSLFGKDKAFIDSTIRDILNS